ncbi:VWA domain-containing protein [Fulvivirga sediminis]|uniref:VWA domain-containing protein n=1 Tax=Fulvivirga sediminis TaxID=2803949 RepID=A0A937FAC5_9BACT|nr:VWA domain-containing protein [Fulvivirga sediminis]MBL3656938.1 VWA domain-containing protein [Fulvivirga sediminis]
MQKPALIFESSPWFILLCLLAGLGYAYLLYHKNGPWSVQTNRVLFVIRSIVVAALAALLVSPVLKQVINNVEEPTIVVAIDNSGSISEVNDSSRLLQIKDKLNALGEQVSGGQRIEYRTLSGETLAEMPDQIHYSEQSTDLNNLLDKIKSDYEGRNLGSVVLVSDGIYNQGISPTFSDYNFKINTIGLGDTIPKSDISISSLLYNKVSYQGNKFPLAVQVDHKNFDNQSVTVSVSKSGKLIDKKNVMLGRSGEPREVSFLIDAENSGFQRYQVEVGRKDGEFTYSNNVKQAYVEVIEGKEQIAIVASAPHPDIKAIKAAIESNANYSIDEYIMSIPKDINRLNASTKKYDLVIFHQLPDGRNMDNRFRQRMAKDEVSTLYVYGGNTRMSSFNQLNGVLSIQAVPNEYDNVAASFNQGFSSFKLTDELQQAFKNWPPIVVPFGRINQSQGAEMLLKQKVGSIETAKPLIAVSAEGSLKKGLILADGIWKWRMFDYASKGNNDLFNELITKLIQYLSSKEDKRKFKVYPLKNEFLTNEKVIFDTEVYNELYERVYGNKIDLVIENSQGESFNYSYVTNENNTTYVISGLDEGVYTYTASTLLSNSRREVKGEFLVKELQLENLNLTADFNLLRKLSDQSGGDFYHSSEMNKLEAQLVENKAKGIIHSQEKYLPFIQLKWLFFLLLALISTEWFIRKYSGSY